MRQACAPGVFMLVSQTFRCLPFRVCPKFIHYFRLGSYYEELVGRDYSTYSESMCTYLT